jgi:hypothetical protein
MEVSLLFDPALNSAKQNVILFHVSFDIQRRRFTSRVPFAIRVHSYESSRDSSISAHGFSNVAMRDKIRKNDTEILEIIAFEVSESVTEFDVLGREHDLIPSH